MNGNTTRESSERALDFELHQAGTVVPDPDWREKVATAKAAREFGARMQRPVSLATYNNVFPR